MKSKKIFFIIVLALILFSPSINTFFISDDWFHLKISQISSAGEFLNFFSFSQTPQSAAFYRPIPTQVFFFVFNSLFGLNSLPFHIFTLSVFGLSLFLLFILLQKLFKKDLAVLGTFLYAISVTHFSRLYFLSAFQEIMMVTFLLASMIFYIQAKTPRLIIFSLASFILALASKETAVIFPALLLLLDWKRNEIKIGRLIPFILVAVIYLTLYITNLGFKTEGSYNWNYSPLKTANTLFWYIFWSFGAPEFLVDYVGSGLKIVPRFFEQFPIWSKIILSLLGLVALGTVLITAGNKNLFKKGFLFGAAFFLVGLLPVLFLPLHKFTLELTLPLIGFCISLAFLVKGSSKKIGYIFLAAYIVMNVASYIITYQTHFAIARSKISLNIYQFFSTNYPEYPRDKCIEFINGVQSSKEWGVSKQIAQVTSYSDMFQVIYKDKSIKVYFEDLPEEKPYYLQPVKLSSLLFLR